MFELIFIGTLLVAVTVVIHALGTHHWVRFLLQRYMGADGHWRDEANLRVLIATAVALMGLHLVEVMVWALTYLWIVPPDQLGSFEQATYFSFVTFTTLGYGDVTLGPEWRLLSGIEAMDGILLVGWTTALLFAVLQRGLRATAGAERFSAGR